MLQNLSVIFFNVFAITLREDATELFLAQKRHHIETNFIALFYKRENKYQELIINTSNCI